MMNSCLEEFTRDINKRGNKKSNLSEDAALFLEVWNKVIGTAARTEEDVGVSSSKKSVPEKNASLKQLESVCSEEPFAAIDEVCENLEICSTN